MSMDNERLDEFLKMLNDQKGFGYNIDIVFVIDATSSMSTVLGKIKQTVLTFHEKLIDHMKERRRVVDKIRIKVITFRDFYFDGEYVYDESKFFEIPEEIKALEAFVNAIEAKGGGDEPESGLEALVKAMRSDFIEDGDGRRHVIVLFTDAPAHSFEDHDELMKKVADLADLGFNPNYPDDMPKNLDEFYRIWDACGDPYSNGQRLILFAPDDTYPWADLELYLECVYRQSININDDYSIDNAISFITLL